MRTPRVLVGTLLAALVALTGCTPAARSELPREARGAEVHAARMRGTATADQTLRTVTDNAPQLAGLDGCLDLRGENSGYLWRCSVLRATAITGTDVPATLTEQQRRLRAQGCAANPGLQQTLARFRSGLGAAYLYDVDYRCPDRTLVAIRFSEPTDPDLRSKLDLAWAPHSPGRANVVSEQPFPDQTVQRLQADTTQRVIMVVVVQRTYWSQPRQP